MTPDERDRRQLAIDIVFVGVCLGVLASLLALIGRA